MNGTSSESLRTKNGARHDRRVAAGGSGSHSDFWENVSSQFHGVERRSNPPGRNNRGKDERNLRGSFSRQSKFNATMQSNGSSIESRFVASPTRNRTLSRWTPGGSDTLKGAECVSDSAGAKATVPVMRNCSAAAIKAPDASIPRTRLKRRLRWKLAPPTAQPRSRALPVLRTELVVRNRSRTRSLKLVKRARSKDATKVLSCGPKWNFKYMAVSAAVLYVWIREGIVGRTNFDLNFRGNQKILSKAASRKMAMSVRDCNADVRDFYRRKYLMRNGLLADGDASLRVIPF